MGYKNYEKMLAFFKRKTPTCCKNGINFFGFGRQNSLGFDPHYKSTVWSHLETFYWPFSAGRPMNVLCIFHSFLK